MMDVPIQPAATVILVRDGADGLETLLLRRSASLVFHGGAWVFPGGRIDPADYQGAPVPDDPADPGHERAARAAAAREAFEEAAILLEPSDLIPFAHWITPIGRPRRFSAWFYLATAPEGMIRTDGGEITEHMWVAPAEALRLQAGAEIELPRPTIASLLRLANSSSSTEAVLDAMHGAYTEVRPQP